MADAYGSDRRQITEQWLANPKNLPAMPAVVQKAIDLMNTDGCGVAEVAETIRQDEATSAQLLRVINSAFYALPTTITTVSRAIAMLGIDQTRWLLLGLSLFGAGGRDRRAEATREEIWKHSILCARLAKAMGSRVRYPSSEEAFLSGLLHDVGKVALAASSPSDFAAATKLSKTHGVSSDLAERTVMGIDHAEAGAIMASHWNFPLLFRSCIALHHNPLPSEIDAPPGDTARLRQLLAIVRAANSATALAAADPPPGKADVRSAMLEISPEALELLTDEIEKMEVWVSDREMVARPHAGGGGTALGR